MHDALLIYLMITNMRHAGYFRFAADLFQSAMARCMATRFAVERNWKVAVRRASALAEFRSGAAANLVPQREWLQALTRLENYVVSMR
jgi:hypothetical protein